MSCWHTSSFSTLFTSSLNPAWEFLKGLFPLMSAPPHSSRITFSCTLAVSVWYLCVTTDSASMTFLSCSFLQTSGLYQSSWALKSVCVDVFMCFQNSRHFDRKCSTFYPVNIPPSIFSREFSPLNSYHALILFFQNVSVKNSSIHLLPKAILAKSQPDGEAELYQLLTASACERDF